MKKFFYVLIIFSLYSNVSLSQLVKWEEIFDSTNITSRGWKIVNTDSCALLFHLYKPFQFLNLGLQNSHIGNYFFKFSFEDANENNLIDDWIITPKLLKIQQGDSISFWCGAIDRTFKDSLKVWISTTDNQLSSFRLIDYFKVDGPAGNWHKKSYDFSEYAGQNIYFAVNYYIKNGGALGIASDNVWVDHFMLVGKGNIEVTSYELAQNFPNPFNPGTEITFSVPNNSNVTIKIYDTSGKEVATLVNGFYERGKYNISFDGRSVAGGLASGVYFYKMVAGRFSDTKKMTMLK